MATLTLRPNATASNSGWTATGGSSTLHGNTSDDDDASLISSIGTGGQQCVLDLGASGLGSATVNSVTIRARAKQGFAADSMSAYQRLSGSDSAADSFALTAAITDYTGATRTTKPGGGAWTVADVDALQVKLDNGTANGAIVYEVYADVDYTAAAGGGGTTSQTQTVI